MSRPGTLIITSDFAAPRSNKPDTATWFVTGLAEKGSHAAALEVTSMSDYESNLGARVSYGILYDALDVFFREGGSKAIVGRVVGPDALAASFTLQDADTDDCLTVTANSVGEWGNSLNVEVTAGDNVGEFILIISHDDDGVLETTPSLATAADAVSWSEGSSFVTITPESSTNDPEVVAATSLSGGTDDRSNITDDEWQAALDLFISDLGAGQVSAPGRTTTAGHAQLLDHAEATNRVAICDGADTDDVDQLISDAADNRLLDSARYGATFVPWITVPGIVANTTRTVPFSAVQAGLCARNDGAGLEPNVPAAGVLGKSRYALDVTQTFSAEDREDLNAGGVNTARSIQGGVRSYGNRTHSDPDMLANWLQLANKRQHMKIADFADKVGEAFVHSQLDGQGITIAQFGGELRAMLVPMWEAGALYGTSFDDAASVDVGDSVNTPTTIQNGELRAAINVRLSPGAELVRIEIVKVPITEAVA